MRLIQRLATQMCKQRAANLRAEKAQAGAAARSVAADTLPKVDLRLIAAAREARKRTEDLEEAVRAKGYDMPSEKGWRRGRITFCNSYDRERQVQIALEQRAQAADKRLIRALRDTLAMTPEQGRAYLATLEDDLEKL